MAIDVIQDVSKTFNSEYGTLISSNEYISPTFVSVMLLLLR